MPTAAPEQTVLLPPPPHELVDFEIPPLPPLGKIRQYESTLWSPAAMAALGAAHPTDIDELGPTDEPTSTKLSSKSRAPSRRRRAA